MKLFLAVCSLLVFTTLSYSNESRYDFVKNVVQSSVQNGDFDRVRQLIDEEGINPFLILDVILEEMLREDIIFNLQEEIRSCWVCSLSPFINRRMLTEYVLGNLRELRDILKEEYEVK